MEVQPSAEEVRNQLEKIASSAGFAGAGRLAPFLRHLVDAALTGGTDGLKESVLGVEFFQRPADFDPRTDPIVRVEARRLRARLEDYYRGAGSQDPIRIDLPKGGYVPVFSRSGDEAPSDVGSGPSRRILLASAASIPILGALGWWGWSRLSRPRVTRIAILPFANLSDDKSSEYLSDGLTEELIDRLAKVPGLKVASRGMVFQFKGSKTDIREIAARVNATCLVEGSVRRQDRRVKISVRLLDASEGDPIWLSTYDREMEDIFALQDELATAIANALRVELKRPAQSTRPSISLEAYNQFLQARYQMNLYSVQGFKRALTHYEKCTELAPQYAPAFADMSVAYTFLGYYSSLPDEIAWKRARDFAARALELDPNLAEAWSAKGLEAGFYRWAWNEAKGSCEQALNLNPSSPLAHTHYALAYLLPTGQVSEAIRHFEEAINLDPLFALAQYVLGFAYLAAHRYEDAIVQYKRTIELGGAHPDLYWDYGMALGYQRRYPEARKAFETKRYLSGEDPADLRGLEAWFSGELDRARQGTNEAVREGAAGRERAMDLARYLAILNMKPEAVHWLEIALAKRERQLIWVLVDPRLDSIRQEPGYAAIVSKIGLQK